LLSQELEGFILSCIKSLWALEALLVIAHDRGRSWTPEELNRELRSNLRLVEDILAQFQRASLVKAEADGRYCYAPATAELERAVEELRIAYADRPLTVVRAVVSAPDAKIRTIADAFKIRKD
jgi:hypothetical protein